MMRLIHDPQKMFAEVAFARSRGNRIGLVPTMGALHEGHLSLVRSARELCDQIVVSIFVNPTQFAPHEDFDKYPRTLEKDSELLAELGVDWIFAPSASSMFPSDFSTFIEPGDIAKRWEGAIRPTHFRGVATVVLKLLQIAPAQVACFGQKDFQQCLVVRRMIEDLNLPVRFEMLPIVREPDGLAMSSRNRYLSGDDRRRAVGIYRALRSAEERFQQGETNVCELENSIVDTLAKHQITDIDYAKIVSEATLEPLQQAYGGCVAMIAVRVGTTRLIDNLILHEV